MVLRVGAAQAGAVVGCQSGGGSSRDPLIVLEFESLVGVGCLVGRVWWLGGGGMLGLG